MTQSLLAAPPQETLSLDREGHISVKVVGQLIDDHTPESANVRSALRVIAGPRMANHTCFAITVQGSKRVFYPDAVETDAVTCLIESAVAHYVDDAPTIDVKLEVNARRHRATIRVHTDDTHGENVVLTFIDPTGPDAPHPSITLSYAAAARLALALRAVAVPNVVLPDYVTVDPRLDATVTVPGTYWHSPADLDDEADDLENADPDDPPETDDLADDDADAQQHVLPARLSFAADNDRLAPARATIDVANGPKVTLALDRTSLLELHEALADAAAHKRADTEITVTDPDGQPGSIIVEASTDAHASALVTFTRHHTDNEGDGATNANIDLDPNDIATRLLPGLRNTIACRVAR